MSKSVQTGEATGKGWKLIQLIGALLLIVGGVWAVAVATNAREGVASNYTAPIVVIFLGAPVWTFGRVGAWWFHG